MGRIKDYLIDLEEMNFSIMNILRTEGLIYNPKELESKIITVGEFNNLLGNNIALLKVIDVVTSYNYPNEELETIKSINDSLFKTLELNVDIYIKVLTTTETYFLKVREELDYYNPTPISLINLEKIIINNNGNKSSRYRSNDYLFIGVKDGNPYNRFKHLKGIEFLVTGLGLNIDSRFNTLEGLIILDGVPSDYKKMELE